MVNSSCELITAINTVSRLDPEWRSKVQTSLIYDFEAARCDRSGVSVSGFVGCALAGEWLVSLSAINQSVSAHLPPLRTVALVYKEPCEQFYVQFTTVRLMERVCANINKNWWKNLYNIIYLLYYYIYSNLCNII